MSSKVVDISWPFRQLTHWQQGVHAHHQPRHSLLVPTVRPPEEILGHEKVQGQEGFLGHEEVPCHREVPNYEEVPVQQDPEREEFPGHENLSILFIKIK